MLAMSELDLKVFWDEALKQIEAEFSAQKKEAEYSLWFRMSYEKSSEKKIIASAPSGFMKASIIQRGYIDIIKNKLFEISGSEFEIELTVKAAALQNSLSNEIKPNFQYQKEETVIPAVIPALHDSPPQTISPHPLLQERYNFENFVSGDNNQFAYNAALAVSRNPGETYNPILFYGGVGLGKTHLMQSIGNYIYKTSNGSKKIICVTAEDFTNEYIQMISSGPKEKLNFKQKYRNTDVLLIDDIHFLQNKTETQEEIFHTFNALYDKKKQLVFTCDRPILELKNITERLKSRFERGLSVDMQPPAYETRRAILEKKLVLSNKNLPDNIINLIAENVSTNVRDLEASLTKILAYIDLIEPSHKPMTMEKAQQILQSTFKYVNADNTTIESIQRTVANHYNISLADIKGKKKTRSIVVPRQIAMYICRKLTEYSTTEIGMEFGNRDHATVMHSCKKIEESIHNDPSMNSIVEQLARSVNSKN